MKQHLTRRELLALIALTGTTSGVLAASAELKLIPAAAVRPPDIPPADPARRPRVAVLGAGLSGLVVAWELSKAGYDCLVLEAARKAGGRILTVRSGDIIEEVGNVQRCEFDDEPHMYFNAGAARIPQQHGNVLHYCRELGVELEYFINENKQAWFQDDSLLGGRRVRNREFTTHLRGFMAEILAKSFDNAALDVSAGPHEAEAVMGVLRAFGDLDENALYKGSARAGYRAGGYLDPSEYHPTIALAELLKSGFAQRVLNANEGETGPALFQPVGGMDKIIDGFTERLAGKVLYNAPVTSLRLGENGVDVGYERDGSSRQFTADYCFSCVPTHLLAGIGNNFPADYRDALGHAGRGEAYKSAFQAKRRFWEDEAIYGGISWTAQSIQQIWYPPHGIHKPKGIILSAYDYGGRQQLTRLTQEQRIEIALRQGEKLHPNYRQEVEKGITIAWHRMNHMLGCSARWQANPFAPWSARAQRLYRLVQQPARGRFYAIGDQVSMHPAWQESAILSAHWALGDMIARAAGKPVAGRGEAV